MATHRLQDRFCLLRFAAWTTALGLLVPAATAFAEELPPAPATAVPETRPHPLTPARTALQAGRIPEAARELDKLSTLTALDPASHLELSALRAQVLLLQKKPAEAAARELVVQVLRHDPSTRLFDTAAPSVRALVEKLRADQVLVLHEAMPPARAGRPIRFKARLSDPQNKVAALTLHYRSKSGGPWSIEPMRQDASGWSGLVRDPSLLAPSGAGGAFSFDYFLTAEDSNGRELDTHGRELSPLTQEVAAPVVESEAPALAMSALVPPPAPAPPPTPWYRQRIYQVGLGVVAAGLVGGLTYALVHEPELPPHLGVLNLP